MCQTAITPAARPVMNIHTTRANTLMVISTLQTSRQVLWST